MGGGCLCGWSALVQAGRVSSFVSLVFFGCCLGTWAHKKTTGGALTLPAFIYSFFFIGFCQSSDDPAASDPKITSNSSAE